MQPQQEVQALDAYIAPLLAFLMAMLKSEYGSRKRSWKKRTLEGVILGVATYAVWPVIFKVILYYKLFGFAQSDALQFSIFFGVTIGYIGVDALSEALHKYYEKNFISK